MTADPRHLRARWTVAGIGWLLWAVSLVLPTSIGNPNHLWAIYLGAMKSGLRVPLRVNTMDGVMQAAVLAGFLFASGLLASSPLLMPLNHSLRPSIRRWRWLGIGLVSMVELSVAIIATRAPLSTWPIHLFTLAHLLVCVAIIPWPRERVLKQSGFEVLIPDQQRCD